jgi:hypothetical protein
MIRKSISAIFADKQGQPFWHYYVTISCDFQLGNGNKCGAIIDHKRVSPQDCAQMHEEVHYCEVCKLKALGLAMLVKGEQK